MREPNISSNRPAGENDYPAGKVVASILCTVIACLTLAWWLGPVTVGAVTQPGDLSGATFVEIRSASGSVEMSGELRDHVDALGNLEKDAALIGTQGEKVIGEIEIEIPREGAADSRQELEVDVISLKPFTTYHVFVNDRPAATFTTDDRGSVDVEFVSIAPVAP